MALEGIDFDKIGKPPTYIEWLTSLPDNHRFAMLASHLLRLKVTKSDEALISFELTLKNAMSSFLQSEMLISNKAYKEYLQQEGYI